MNTSSTQRKLGDEQIGEFHHDLFVETQLQHFVELFASRIAESPGVVLDMGGGCGFFANALARRTGASSRVVDADPVSVAKARDIGVDAQVGDALAPVPAGDESVVCFNLILHHLVAASDAGTHELQSKAIAAWAGSDVRLFVNEYIYESYIPNFSGRVIFEITSSSFLSAIGRLVAKVVPSLKANTFGVGVRFREASDWKSMFEQAGWRVVSTRRGEDEYISLPRRMLLIKSCRRDSFALAPTIPE